MISIIGKQMIFPNEEQTFILGDGESTSRTFILNRYEADRVDISNLTFRLDVEYKGGQKDSLLLVKAVQEKQILLQWDIKQEDLKENGTVFVALRGFDADGVVRWTSAKTPIFVENVIDTPGSWEGKLSELEQMEQNISVVLDSEAERKQAENARIAAEELRRTAFEAAMKAAEEAIEKALNAEGPQGKKGEPFTYDDFTEEQLEALKGEPGTPGKDGYTPVKGKDYFDGEKGERGETGDGLRIICSFETEEALRTGVASPSGGDAYGVGEAAPYDIYIYDERKQDWVNHGRLQGAKGEKGEPFTYDDFTDEQLEALKGEPGKPGKDGYTPKKGVDYFDGEKGDPFTYDDFTAEQLEALKGEPGKDGYTPVKGKDYLDGVDGKDGRDGVDGADGKSAFAAAQEAGYQGTEAELYDAFANVPGHIADNNIHVTAQEKANWNGKADGDHTHTPYSIGAAGNPNLLDNWYFADPINQRGWTNGVTSYQYSLDRWFSNDVNVTVNDGFVTLAQSGTSNLFFIQRIEPDFYKNAIEGKTITLSALLRNGYLKTATVTATAFQSNMSSDINVDGLMFGVYSSANEHGFRIFPTVGYSFDIVAVKAEFGTQQTLARQENGVWVLNDAPPNKQQELAKCQRYFQRFRTETERKTYCEDFRPTMRMTDTGEIAKSTITVDGVTYYTASADL